MEEIEAVGDKVPEVVFAPGSNNPVPKIVNPPAPAPVNVIMLFVGNPPTGTFH